MTAVLGVSASSAAAADVWMWACHGPNGQAVNSGDKTLTGGEGQVQQLATGCGGDASQIDAGYTLRFARAAGGVPAQVSDPAANSFSQVEVILPAGMNAKQIRVLRRTHGFAGAAEAGNAQHYTATFNGALLESRQLDSGPRGDLTSQDTYTIANPASGSLIFKLSCNQATQCPASAAPVSVDIISVAFFVSDGASPTGGVNRNSPVDKGMQLGARFMDEGIGLERAELRIDRSDGGAPVFASARFGDCTDLSEGPAVNDRPLDPVKCPRDLTTATLSTSDVKDIPEGKHRRTITVFDAAGNSTIAVYNEEFEIFHPAEPIATRTLSIGTAGIVVPEPGGPSNPDDGRVAGTQRTSCRTPRLSVVLDSKPLRVRRGVPVLKYRKAYRFEGRLTCVINGRRRSAPKRTRIEVLNTVGRRTVRKPNTLIRSRGAVNVRLAFVSSRTVVFRYTNADGQRSQVRIRVRVAKK